MPGMLSRRHLPTVARRRQLLPLCQPRQMLHHLLRPSTLQQLPHHQLRLLVQLWRRRRLARLITVASWGRLNMPRLPLRRYLPTWMSTTISHPLHLPVRMQLLLRLRRPRQTRHWRLRQLTWLPQRRRHQLQLLIRLPHLQQPLLPTRLLPRHQSPLLWTKQPPR